MKECAHFEECPSATGWCLNGQPDKLCLQVLLQNFETHLKLASKAYDLRKEIEKEINENDKD